MTPFTSLPGPLSASPALAFTLVFVVALLAQRSAGSEDLRDMGGIAFRAPVLAVLFLVLTLALLAMPGSSNFIGEFLILLGAFQSKTAIAIIASVGVGMAAVYALRLYIRSMHNRVGPHATPLELSLRDGLVLVAMILAIGALSLYPQFGLGRSEKDTALAIAKSRAVQAGQTLAEAPAAGREAR